MKKTNKYKTKRLIIDESFLLFLFYVSGEYSRGRD